MLFLPFPYTEVLENAVTTPQHKYLLVSFQKQKSYQYSYIHILYTIDGPAVLTLAPLLQVEFTHGVDNLALGAHTKLLIGGIESVHLVLGAVVMPKHEPEDASAGEGDAGKASVECNHVWVAGLARHADADGAAESDLQQKDGRYQRLHGRRRLGVCVFQAGDGCEDLGQADEDVCWRLKGHVGAVGDAAAVRGRACQRPVEARALVVDVVLDAGGVGHRRRHEEEAGENAGDGAEWNAQLAQERVDALLYDWDEDDDGDWVQVEEQVVGQPVRLHRPGHRYERGVHLAIEQPEGWVEEEDAAGHQRPLEFGDELFAELRRGGVHVEVVAGGDGEGLARIEEDRSLRRANHILVLADKKDNRSQEEEA